MSKKKITEGEMDKNIQEDGAAATLRPNADGQLENPTSRFQAMAAIIGGLAAIEDKSTLDQVLAMIGHEADAIPPAAAAQNAATVAMKTVAAEEAEAIFSGEGLTEEFKEKAKTLFETALEARVALESEALKEEYAKKLDEAVVAATEDLTEKLDKYLDNVINQWIEENRVAVESSLRTEMVESFIVGMKGLFEDHYIDLPEAKVDVVKELAEKVEVLDTRYAEKIEENYALKAKIDSFEKNAAFETISEGLALTQKEKLRKLVESVEYTGDADGYAKKLKLVKEHYFPANSKAVDMSDGLAPTDVNTKQETVATTPEVMRYVQHLNATSVKTF